MNKKILVVLSGLLIGGASLQAQERVKHKENFFGLGRAVVSNEGLSDETSTNEDRSTNGYTIFDLGIKMQRNEIFQAHAILRVRNEFGGFYGNGASFDFREIRLGGLLGKVVKYEIGDLDVALTPYTIYNSEPGYYKYENELIAMKRDILRYENFYTGDKSWRMQGVNAYTTLNLGNDFVKQAYVRFFGNRVAPTNNIDLGDRFVWGGRLAFINSKDLRIGFNMAATQDLAMTVPDASVDYDNHVYTTDFRALFDMNTTFKIGVEGEAGISNYKMYQAVNDTTVRYDDGFFDVNAVLKHKKSGLEFKVGYKVVGQNFSSPTAQTRRVNDYAQGKDLTFYPSYNDQTTERKSSLFDRYSQENGLYSRSISTTLDPFSPIYGNMNPYGVATPNRKGLNLGVNWADSSKRWELDVKYALQSEFVGQNVADTRSFNNLIIGTKINVNRFIGWNKAIAVYGSYNNEVTKRDNPGVGVDFKSSIIDASLDVEVINRLHLIGGVKMLAAEGYEFTIIRDEFNNVSERDTPSQVNYDITDQVIVAGMKYDFGANSFFGLSAQFAAFEDNATVGASTAYDLNQVYLVYQIKF